MIVTVDGDPNKNLRYEKTMNCSIKYFVQSGLDAIFLAINAPGHSALNCVEHRMAKLGKELESLNMINLGVILMQRVWQLTKMLS